MEIVIFIHKNFEWICSTIKHAFHELMIKWKINEVFIALKVRKCSLYKFPMKKMFAYSFAFSSTHSILSYPINLHHDCDSKSRILEQRDSLRRKNEEETSTNFSRANDS